MQLILHLVAKSEMPCSPSPMACLSLLLTLATHRLSLFGGCQCLMSTSSRVSTFKQSNRISDSFPLSRRRSFRTRNPIMPHDTLFRLLIAKLFDRGQGERVRCKRTLNEVKFWKCELLVTNQTLKCCDPLHPVLIKY
jgi:hypothetical protein